MENKRSFKWSNLDDDGKEGLISLRKKLKAQDLVNFQNDKSGQYSMDSNDMYSNYKALQALTTLSDNTLSNAPRHWTRKSKHVDASCTQD